MITGEYFFGQTVAQNRGLATLRKIVLDQISASGIQSDGAMAGFIDVQRRFSGDIAAVQDWLKKIDARIEERKSLQC